MTNFNWLLDGSIVGVYLLVTMIAGLMVRKYVGNVEDFLVAGREMDVYLGIASLAATEFGIVTCMYTAQNGYEKGFAGATPFCRLLRAVAATGLPRIKFTTSFPRDFHPDIVTAIEENPNLCDWVHLPVQSGSDRILKLMRRGHKRSDYLARIERIKNSSRRLALTSDIIVGFPGETDEDFQQTIELVRECDYDSLYIFKYSKRAGTPAAEFHDNVSETEKTARFIELEKVHRAAQEQIYRSYVGRTLSVLAERQSSRSEKDLSGHSTCHKVVNFEGDSSLEGEIVDVLVTTAKTNSLYGNLLQDQR